MMLFRTIKQAIVDTLSAAAAGRYVVIGEQRQVSGANELENKFVRVFYDSGQFTLSASSSYGRKISHDITFQVELSVGAKSLVDLTILNNENSTALQLSAALLAFKNAAALADEKIDELFDNVFQVIMDARNCDFGLTAKTVTGRWIQSYQKDKPLPEGEYVILTGAFQITCSVNEEITGETGIAGTAFDVTMQIKDDQNNAGISGTLGGNSG